MIDPVRQYMGAKKNLSPKWARGVFVWRQDSNVFELSSYCTARIVYLKSLTSQT